MKVKNIQKRVVKDGIMTPKIGINPENPQLSDRNKRFEAAVTVLPRGILEEHLREIMKDYEFLRDVPLKTRKEEAIKPMYLIRYE